MTNMGWLEKNKQALCGRTVALTGATGGIGQELCRWLLVLGARLVLLDRNQERSAALCDRLLKDFPQAQLCRVPLDLTSLASVRAACDRLEQMEIDVLIHNAGAYAIERCKCDTGYDNVFQINFLAPYYMTRRLLPYFRTRTGARVVAVGSIAHRYSKTDADDVDFSTRRRASLVYGNAKRYLMLALEELFSTEDEVTLSVVHPGITLTNITAHYPKALYALIRPLMRLVFPPARRAALCVMRGVLESTESGEWIGPRFCDVWGAPVHKRLRSYLARERQSVFQSAERIWCLLCQGELSGDA